MTVGLLEAAMFAGCTTATAPETGAAQESGQTEESGESEQKGEDSPVTMDEVWEANTPAKLLENHDSISVAVRTGESLSMVIYQTKDMYAEIQSGGELPEDNYSYITDGEYEGCIYADSEGNERFARILYAMEDAETVPLEEMMPVLTEECLDRTISESSTEGTFLTAKAVLDEAETRAVLGETFGLLIPEEYKDATMEYVFRMDAATLELENLTKTLKLADGTSAEFEKTEVSFDEAAPDAVQRIADLLDDSLNAEEDRSITVIAEPKTENEETFSFDIGRGISANIVCEDGYALFTDMAGRDLFFFDDSEKDMTLYALPVKEVYPVSSYSEAGPDLEDGVYSGQIDPDSVKKDGDTWKVTAEIFGYEQFSASDIADISAGDVIYILEKPVTVKSVTVLNGPSGNAAGVTVTDRYGTAYKLLKEEKIYYVKGEDTSHQLYSLGSAEFAFADDMNIVDTTRETPASDAEVTGIGDLPNSIQNSKNKDWSAAANDIILQGGTIARIVRKEAE